MNKQIEEIANVIFESSPVPELWRSPANRIAEAIYNEGYRKASEVAREIFAEIEIKVSPMLGLEDDKEYAAILVTDFDELKKKYEVPEG